MSLILKPCVEFDDDRKVCVAEQKGKNIIFRMTLVMKLEKFGWMVVCLIKAIKGVIIYLLSLR